MCTAPIAASMETAEGVRTLEKSRWTTDDVEQIIGGENKSNMSIEKLDRGFKTDGFGKDRARSSIRRRLNRHPWMK